MDINYKHFGLAWNDLGSAIDHLEEIDGPMKVTARRLASELEEIAKKVYEARDTLQMR
jgi:hypothetical protein